MKKVNFLTSCLAVFLASLLLVAAAWADIDGFKGMRWGSALSEIQRTKKLVLTKENGANGSSLYSLENEELRFGVASLTGIHCSFSQERLQGVILLFKSAKDFAAMKSEAFAQFGESKRYDQNGEEMYSWVGEITNIVLSYNRGSQSGFLFMKPKKTTEQPKGQERRQDERETEQETALDRASAVQREEFVPESITPEIQGLIDRDLALTRLCWDSVGPEADNACGQMQESVQKLTALGMCMTPRDPNIPGPDITWSRCKPPVGSVSSQEEKTEALCRLVGELFESAAQLRNEGASPQTAETELSWHRTGWAPQITEERIEETVDLVYFDPEFASIWGSQLNRQIYESCLTGRGPYLHPLQ